MTKLKVGAATDASCHVETVTGKLVNPMDPKVETIDITDIAWSLSRISRFVGHTVTAVPYNVAQHSVYVSNLVQDFVSKPEKFSAVVCPEKPALLAAARNVSDINELLLKALFHDAHEAYIGDMPSPIKRIPELRPIIKAIEAKLDDVIIKKLELSPITDEQQLLIKFGDRLAQAIEGYQYMPSRGVAWDLPKPSIILIQNFPEPLKPLESMQQFMETYHQLRRNSWTGS